MTSLQELSVSKSFAFVVAVIIMATVPYFSLVDEDFTRKLTEDAAADDDIDYEEDRKLMYYAVTEGCNRAYPP